MLPKPASTSRKTERDKGRRASDVYSSVQESTAFLAGVPESPQPPPTSQLGVLEMGEPQGTHCSLLVIAARMPPGGQWGRGSGVLPQPLPRYALRAARALLPPQSSCSWPGLWAAAGSWLWRAKKCPCLPRCSAHTRACPSLL